MKRLDIYGKEVILSTVIRPEVSKKNKYWISKHRYYELKHLCLQYKELKKEYNELIDFETSNISNERVKKSISGSKVEDIAILRHSIASRIDCIETAAKETDEYFAKAILRSVTCGIAYPKMKARYNVPCSKDVWYEIYRRFFFILSNKRN